VNDYDDMTNADVMSGEELAEYDRDAEFRLDAADEQRALEEDAAARAAEPDEDMEDCGAVAPDDMCGICDGCRESIGDDIEHQVEDGSMTESEAYDAHMLNGTWG
jgi:hypothetical protein